MPADEQGGSETTLDLAAEAGLALTDATAAHAKSTETSEKAYWEGVQTSALANAAIDRKRAKRDMRLRKEYAGKAYWLAVAGVIFWVLAFLAYAVVKGVWDKEIFSDSVMISITAGATVNVAAAFLGVIRGLFPAAHAPLMSHQLALRQTISAGRPRQVNARKTGVGE